MVFDFNVYVDDIGTDEDSGDAILNSSYAFRPLEPTITDAPCQESRGGCGGQHANMGDADTSLSLESVLESATDPGDDESFKYSLAAANITGGRHDGGVGGMCTISVSVSCSCGMEEILFLAPMT